MYIPLTGRDCERGGGGRCGLIFFCDPRAPKGLLSFVCISSSSSNVGYSREGAGSIRAKSAGEGNAMTHDVHVHVAML